ncbi:uncharacterized protein LOC128474049 [Spea bombifrons]|uniref:uncharacterized protein LOC128474049 n=1 Tax=Spea bombifrons TaxID=233779 RepID=UPI00234AD744|nr:uncharacterized protein LOC128474049 [Spea bombifrons]
MEEVRGLTKKILDYRLENNGEGKGYNHIMMQIFGYMGNGKSSLINSLMSIVKEERYRTLAPVATGHEKNGALTTHRTSYPLTDTITLVDNRGFGPMDSYEEQEIYAQLANILPLNEKVIWEKSFMDTVIKVQGSVENRKDLLVPLYIYSAEQGCSSKPNDIKTFLQNCQKMTGILPIIVLTKSTSSKLAGVCKQFQDMGMESIIAIENYIPENNIRTPGKDTKLLSVLTEALRLVDFRIQTLSDPEADHNERMKLLLSLANEREIEKVREEERKKIDEELQMKKQKKWYFW